MSWSSAGFERPARTRADSGLDFCSGPLRGWVGLRGSSCPPLYSRVAAVVVVVITVTTAFAGAVRGCGGEERFLWGPACLLGGVEWMSGSLGMYVCVHGL